MKFLILTAVVILVSGCQTATPPKSTNTVFPAPLENVSETASLAIFVNGTKIDLTKSTYAVETETITLDPKFPGIIQIKKSPLTWSELFLASPLDISAECLTLDSRTEYCNQSNNQVRIFLNGTLTNSLKSQTIQDGDEILLTYGDETGIEIERQLNQVP